MAATVSCTGFIEVVLTAPTRALFGEQEVILSDGLHIDVPCLWPVPVADVTPVSLRLGQWYCPRCNNFNVVDLTAQPPNREGERA